MMVAMYIERVPNRNSPPCILLRESYREGGRVCKRTLANLTKCPPEVVDAVRGYLAGKAGGPVTLESLRIDRSLPHGHVAAVLGVLRRLALDKLISTRRCPERDRVVAMIVARLIDPQSKLATARGFCEATATSSIGLECGLDPDLSEDELYTAMDWLLDRQDRIQNQLAARHLADGALVLYDVSSSYFEGRTCPLAKFGHNRDGKHGKLQIVYGLLCNADGCPVAIEVFDGNTGDPTTVAAQIDRIRRQFGLRRVVLVGDRGMITEARIKEDLKPVEGLDWITALRAPNIRKLREQGLIQPELFDDRDLAEICSPDFPGERLVACRNPFLAAERGRKRNALLAATERELDQVAQAVRRTRSPLRGSDRIGLRAGKIANRFKMQKHFRLAITDTTFTYERDLDAIREEAALDGIYVVRSSVPAAELDAEQLVLAYKGLSVVERAFRSLKSVDLLIRPIHHRLADRVRAHVFLCMLALYVEWHLRQALAPMLFDDEDAEAAEALRGSVVRPRPQSPSAASKAHTKRTADNLPVHSFRTLLADLATIVKNRLRLPLAGVPPCWKTTEPTPVQSKALSLLGIDIQTSSTQ